MGRKLMRILEVCGDRDEFVVSLGEKKSSRSSFGPGLRCTRALKWDSQTGQKV